MELKNVTYEDMPLDLGLPKYQVGDIISSRRSGLSKVTQYEIRSVKYTVVHNPNNSFVCKCDAHKKAYEAGAYEEVIEEMRDERRYDDDYDSDDLDIEYDEVEPNPEIYLSYCTCRNKPECTQLAHYELTLHENSLSQYVYYGDEESDGDYIIHWDAIDVMHTVLPIDQDRNIRDIKVGAYYVVRLGIGLMEMQVHAVENFTERITFKYKGARGKYYYTKLSIHNVVGLAGGSDERKVQGDI